MLFTLETFSYPVRTPVLQAFNAIWQRLAEPGYWWTGAERIAIAEVLRKSKPRELFDRKRPNVSELSTEPTLGQLSPLAVDTIERIATESGSLNAEWCAAVCERLGEGAYVELVAVVVLVLPIDRFCLSLGAGLQPLPTPISGKPSQLYPPGLVHAGAWVRQTQTAIDNPELVNVSRALSMTPIENDLRRDLVEALYMEGHSFFDAVWDRKALSRPQLELAATRTSVINKCFYCAQGHTSILDISSKSLGEKASLEAAQGQEVNEVGVTNGELILAYTEAVNREPDSAHQHFAQLITTFGVQGAIELAAVVAIFNGLNRTSDPTGVPLESSLMAYGRLGNKIEKLGLNRLNGIANAESLGLFESLRILLVFKLRRLFGGRG